MRRKKTLQETAIFGRKPAHTPVVPVKPPVSLNSVPVPPLIAADTEKLALWNFICTDLAKRSILNNTYVLLIELLIHDVAIYQRMLPELESEGSVYSTFDKQGNEVKRHNPLFSQIHLVHSRIIKALERLGMTPKDIIYVTNPSATAQIEAVADERKRINYFK